MVVASGKGLAKSDNSQEVVAIMANRKPFEWLQLPLPSASFPRHLVKQEGRALEGTLGVHALVSSAVVALPKSICNTLRTRFAPRLPHIQPLTLPEWSSALSSRKNNHCMPIPAELSLAACTGQAFH